MLRKKALRKMIITTMSLFIIMAIYMIPTTNEHNLQTTMEMKYVNTLGNHYIYLLDENNRLVKTKILLDGKNTIENAKIIITNLTKSDNTKFQEQLKPVLPTNTKVLDITYQKQNKTITLNFSKEFLKLEKEEKAIESIVYSLTELNEITNIIIKVENVTLDKYPNSKQELPIPLTRKIGINKQYDLTNTKNITKTVIYYLENLDNNLYYVPVTKYTNDSQDKINIIVEELTTGYIYEPNLISLLDEKTKLIDYHQEEDVLFLNFNDALFDSNGKIQEEVLYTLCYSIFDNYDVNVISIAKENNQVKTLTRNTIGK